LSLVGIRGSIAEESDYCSDMDGGGGGGDHWNGGAAGGYMSDVDCQRSCRVGVDNHSELGGGYMSEGGCYGGSEGGGPYSHGAPLKLKFREEVNLERSAESRPTDVHNGCAERSTTGRSVT